MIFDEFKRKSLGVFLTIIDDFAQIGLIYNLEEIVKGDKLSKETKCEKS
jgi:hypothetical protein